MKSRKERPRSRLWKRFTESLWRRFDGDLQRYLRSSMFVGKLFPLKLEKTESVAAEPAPMFDVKLALLDLSSRRQNEAEVRKGLEELIREDPKRSEPHVLLGYLAARSGQP